MGKHYSSAVQVTCEQSSYSNLIGNVANRRRVSAYSLTHGDFDALWSRTCVKHDARVDIKRVLRALFTNNGLGVGGKRAADSLTDTASLNIIGTSRPSNETRRESLWRLSDETCSVITVTVSQSVVPLPDSFACERSRHT